MEHKDDPDRIKRCTIMEEMELDRAGADERRGGMY